MLFRDAAWGEQRAGKVAMIQRDVKGKELLGNFDLRPIVITRLNNSRFNVTCCDAFEETTWRLVLHRQFLFVAMFSVFGRTGWFNLYNFYDAIVT